MKIKLIALALAAGLTLPVAAQAHVTRGELHRDVQHVRSERHELKDERREHDWRGVRAERRDLKHARGELRRDSHRFVRQHRRHLQ